MKIQILVIFAVLLVLIALSEGRGGRGGGGRGGSRGSSSRSSRSSRGSSSSSRSSRSLSRSATRYGASWWVAGAVIGYTAARMRIYGMHYYQRRRLYRSSSEPTVCHNYKYGCLRDEEDFRSANLSVQQQTILNSSWCQYDFICPSINDDDDDHYCCGKEHDGGQYCCGFWDSPGRAAGASIGIIIGIGAVLGCVLCVCCYYKRKKSCSRSSSSSRYIPQTSAQYPQPRAPSAADNMEMAPPAYNDAQNYSAGYAPSPDKTAPPADAPPYPSADAPPYPAAPYPPPGTTPYPPQGNLPYPTNPMGYPPQPYPPQPYPPADTKPAM